MGIVLAKDGQGFFVIYIYEDVCGYFMFLFYIFFFFFFRI